MYLKCDPLQWAKGCALLVVVGVRLLGQPSGGGGDERAAWAVYLCPRYQSELGFLTQIDGIGGRFAAETVSRADGGAWAPSVGSRRPCSASDGRVFRAAPADGRSSRFAAWGLGYLSLERVLGDKCGPRGMFGGYVARSGILRSRIPVDGSAVDTSCACP